VNARQAHFELTFLFCTFKFELGVGLPVRGYAKGGDADNVEFVGIAA
jgi:hypothetical protein